MLHHIYRLIDPRTNDVCYVGITNRDPKTRLKQHIYSSDDEMACNDEKKAWIRELLGEGLEPVISVVESIADREEARLREKHWIRAYIALGAPLTNAVLIQEPAKVVEPQGPSPLQQRIANAFYTTREAQDKLGVNSDKFKALIARYGIDYHTFLGGTKRYYIKSEINELAAILEMSM